MNTTENKVDLQTLNHLVLFDGVCGLCNRFIDFLLRKDMRQKLLFAPLQGETARLMGVNTDTNDLKTVIFYKDGKLYRKSDALIEILKCMGGAWKISGVLSLFPLALRNYFYDFVAKNRMKWFGQRDTCRMPSAHEKGRILH